MDSYTFKNTGANVFTLSGKLDFETVPALLKASSGMFTRDAMLQVDLGGVSQANSAAMALLIEWKSMAVRSGSTIHFANLPVQIERIATVCKIDDLLSQ